MKKTIAILLTLIMVIGCSTTVFAASNSPILTLEKNQYNDNGERHIKVSWEGLSKSCILEIDDNEDFTSPETKTRSLYNVTRNGKCYNFVLSENVDDTYYIRVRYSNSEEWSNVVIAEIDNKIEDEPNLPSYSFVPNLSGIDFSNLINIDWSKIKFPTLTVK